MTPEVLLNEIKEHHEYTRQLFDLLIHWFTFFVTVLLTAYSWILVSDARVRVEKVIRPIGVFFLVQITLGIAACVIAAHYFNAMHARVDNLVAAAGMPSGGPSADPIGLYIWVCGLLITTLLVFAAFWIWLMFFRRTK